MWWPDGPGETQLFVGSKSIRIAAGHSVFFLTKDHQRERESGLE
jgi:hypothetical protein